jgi:hypothetical protein
MKDSPSRQDPPVPAQCEIRGVAPPQAAVGVDVGEDFLDLAVLRIDELTLQYHRIALRGIEAAPLEMIRERLRECCPGVGPRWLALIDSPRWPLDLDCSKPAVVKRDPMSPGRMLDRELRAILRLAPGRAAMPLSMFPTPRLEYFTGCVRQATCKPHLRAAYTHLFGLSDWPLEPAPSGGAVKGGTFTRFMLTGFLAFRAFRSLGAPTLEAYPDLQFRLSAGAPLQPKRAGQAALAQRVAINRKLRHIIGIKRAPLPATIDQADAEILVLSAALAARRGSLCALEHPAEGSFLLTMKRMR